MPQKFRAYTKELDDGRRKLTQEQKETILKHYEAGGISWQNLADAYGVSKRAIGFIVNEKTLEKVRERIKRHWKDYYNKEERKDTMRKYRAKKRKKGLVLMSSK